MFHRSHKDTPYDGGPAQTKQRGLLPDTAGDGDDSARKQYHSGESQSNEIRHDKMSGTDTEASSQHPYKNMTTNPSEQHPAMTSLEQRAKKPSAKIQDDSTVPEHIWEEMSKI